MEPQEVFLSLMRESVREAARNQDGYEAALKLTGQLAMVREVMLDQDVNPSSVDAVIGPMEAVVAEIFEALNPVAEKAKEEGVDAETILASIWVLRPEEGEQLAWQCPGEGRFSVGNTPISTDEGNVYPVFRFGAHDGTLRLTEVLAIDRLFDIARGDHE